MTSKAALGAGSPAAGPPDLDPSDMPSTCSQDSDIVFSHDLDVTMAESTYAFKNTMHMDDLGGGAVTPPSCVASVPILAELAKAIEDEK